MLKKTLFALLVSSMVLPLRLSGQTDPDVIAVFKTHMDIGYTGLATETINHFRTVYLDTVLSTIDKTKSYPADLQFKWTLAGWPVKKALENWSGQTTQRKDRIIAAIKNHRLSVHALPYTLHTESTDPEDLVRGLIFSSQISRANGLPLPRDCKMTDVPSHAWIMPTLLKNAGIDFFHIGCNDASHPVNVPKLFFWEGPDGSRVLTFYSNRYGEPPLPTGGWTYSAWLALIVNNDNTPPIDSAGVYSIINQIKNAGKKPVIGRMSDFYDLLSKSSMSAIPVIRGDMPDSWIHGIASLPQETKLARNIRPAIGSLNGLNTWLKASGIPAGNIDSSTAYMYDHSCRYTEHTWAHFSQPQEYGSVFIQNRASGKYNFIESTSKEKAWEMTTTDSVLRPAIANHMRLLATSVNAAGKRIVVYNPLPWQRNGVVKVKLSEAVPAALRDVTSGDTLAVAASADTVIFIARNVPPMGYRTYTYAGSAPGGSAGLVVDRTQNVIENEFFKVTISPAKGGITSILDKKANRELVDATKPYAFGSYMNERFSGKDMQAYNDSYCTYGPGSKVFVRGLGNIPLDPYVMFKPSNMTIAYDSSAIAVSASISDVSRSLYYKGLTIRVALYAGLPYIDMTWMIDTKVCDNWPAADWFCFPCKVASPKFRLGRLGGIMDPANDVLRGANRHLFGVAGGVAVYASDNLGVGMCSRDVPLVSLDRPGLWKYSLDFVPQDPTVFFNLWNNQWCTNFSTYPLKPSWSADVRVWSINSYDAEKELVTPSEETRQPLWAEVANSTAGKLPVTNTGLTVSRKGIAVTAFGPNPDGSGTILRLWELAGNNGQCTVTLPATMLVTNVTPVNLRGVAAGTALSLTGNSFTFDMPHNAVKSFMFSYVPTGVVQNGNGSGFIPREITVAMTGNSMRFPPAYIGRSVVVRVFDLKGRMVRQEMVKTAGNGAAKRFALPEGLYIVKMRRQ